MSPSEQNPIFLPLKTFSSLQLGVGVLPLSFCYEPLRELLLGNSLFSSEILFGQGIFADVSPSKITRNYHALSTSPNTNGMVGHAHRTLFTVYTFCLALT